MVARAVSGRGRVLSELSRATRAEIDRLRRVPRGRPADVPRPGPAQESVWDYPRPPRVERVAKRVRVEFAGLVIAETTSALRVVETAGAPVYYLPRDEVAVQHLTPQPERSLCEWKGQARYWTLRVGDRTSRAAAFSYAEPFEGYDAIRDHLAFYAGRVDACSVGGVAATPQPGGFYAGWVTPEILGPIKGVPGSEGW